MTLIVHNERQIYRFVHSADTGERLLCQVLYYPETPKVVLKTR